EAVLIALMKPTTAMKEAIKGMGYESAQLAIKDIGLTEVLKKLKESTSGSADKMAELFGRKEALVGVSALASKNFETLTGKIGAMAEKTGMADKAWQEYMTTLNALWDTFKNTIGNMLIKIGEKLAPAIKNIIEATSDWLTENQRFITQDIASIIDAMTTSVKALGKAYKATKGLFFDPTELQKAEKAARESRIAWMKALGEIKGKVAEIVKLEKEIVKGEKDKWSWAGVRLTVNKMDLRVAQDAHKELEKQLTEKRKIYLEDQKILKSLKGQTDALKITETQTGKIRPLLKNHRCGR
ncbi:unnamed protein product, partial [marine sediment metagenome]